MSNTSNSQEKQMEEFRVIRLVTQGSGYEVEAHTFEDSTQIIRCGDFRSSEGDSCKIWSPISKEGPLPICTDAIEALSNEVPGELGPGLLRWRFSGVRMRLIPEVPVKTED